MTRNKRPKEIVADEAARRCALARLETALSAAAGEHGGTYRLLGEAARTGLPEDTGIELLAHFPKGRAMPAIRAATAAAEAVGIPCKVRNQAWCSNAYLLEILPGAKVIAMPDDGERADAGEET